MGYEQQFRPVAAVAYGSGSTAAVLASPCDFAHANMQGTGGCLMVMMATATKIRGISVTVTTAIATTAPTFTTLVFTLPSAGGTTGTSRTVDNATSIPVGTIAGTTVFSYFSDDDIRVNPGEMVVIRTGTAAGTGAGYVSLMTSDFVIGPTSGGTVTVPVVRPKPYGPSPVGSIYIVSTGTGNN